MFTIVHLTPWHWFYIEKYQKCSDKKCLVSQVAKMYCEGLQQKPAWDQEP